MKNHHLSPKGFTLVELLVSISIILVLAGVIAPVGRGVIARSHTINCSKNLHQIGVASLLYAGENNMTLPVSTHQRRDGGKSWTLTLQPYVTGGDAKPITFKCHEDENEVRDYTYMINDFLTPNPAGAPDLNYSILAKIDQPEATLLFAEASPTYTNSDHFHFSEYHGGNVPPQVFEHQVATGAHGETANYLFADGHVKTLTSLEVNKRLRAVGSRFVDPSGQ